MGPDLFLAIARMGTLLGGAALLILALAEWQGLWAALSGLGAVLFLLALTPK